MSASESRGTAVKLLVLLVSFLVCIGIAEIAIRMLPESTLGYHYDVASGRFSLPREFTLNKSPNSLGFHDLEPRPARPDVTRILLLGDSYVESYSALPKDVVGKRLEHYLNASGRGKFEVVSIAESGWGQIDELAALEKWGPKLRPDFVLTLFLALNDVENNSAVLRRRTKLQNLDPELMMRPGWTRRSADTMPLFFIKGSALNQLISHRLAWGLLRKRGDVRATTPVDYFVYATEIDEDWAHAWRETERLVVQTRDVARRLGAGYALASASTPQGVLGVNAGLAVLLEAYPQMLEHEWDLALPDRRMASLAARNGIPFEALEPAFREAAAEGATLHWPFDAHWTPAGNDLAGERLAEFLLGLNPEKRAP